MAEPKLSGTPQVDLDALINSAWGDKPVSVQKHFDNEMMQRAADLIAGKKDALHKDMFGQEPISKVKEIDDEQLAAEPTEQEIEDALNDEDTDDELESLVDSDEQEETQEEEPSDEEPSEEETDETS
tara:strand:- start:1263 stop:1643 length:381 start_codon:yes stop_codon:yes gene_type:complete